jgi:general secretion pathway protein G
MNYQARHHQGGFTLIEMVIAIMILGLIGAVGITAYLGRAEEAQKETTKTNLRSLKQNIDLFYLQLNAYPTKLEDLAQRPAGDLGKKWTRAYIDKVPRDAWDQEFRYKLTPGGKRPYELYSFGGNNEEPEKRINVWDL